MDPYHPARSLGMAEGFHSPTVGGIRLLGRCHDRESTRPLSLRTLTLFESGVTHPDGMHSGRGKGVPRRESSLEFR